eukprot:jgi/Mesvir1/13923/Mv16044-RA.1
MCLWMALLRLLALARCVRKKLQTPPTRGGGGDQLLVKRVFLSHEDEWGIYTTKFREVCAAGPLRLPPAALLEKLGAHSFATHRRLSMSVVYGYGGREYVVTYDLDQPDREVVFPPWPGDNPRCGEDKAGRAHKRAVLSATLGRCSPHPDDKDITDALSAFLGPDRDFYASAGLPQYIWCIIRHIGIDAIVTGASDRGRDQQSDVQAEFMRVIYGNGECLLFHPKAGGCLITGGVKVG